MAAPARALRPPVQALSLAGSMLVRDLPPALARSGVEELTIMAETVVKPYLRAQGSNEGAFVHLHSVRLVLTGSLLREAGPITPEIVCTCSLAAATALCAPGEISINYQCEEEDWAAVHEGTRQFLEKLKEVREGLHQQ